MSLGSASRWSFLFLLFPKFYLQTDHPYWRLNIPAFSERFEWEQDEWNGLKDTVQAPIDTWMSESGDCEDYAALIASCLLAQTNKSISIAYLLRDGSGHMVCFTDEKVYSSGDIFEKSFAQYLEDSGYRKILTREIQ